MAKTDAPFGIAKWGLEEIVNFSMVISALFTPGFIIYQEKFRTVLNYDILGIVVMSVVISASLFIGFILTIHKLYSYGDYTEEKDKKLGNLIIYYSIFISILVLIWVFKK